MKIGAIIAASVFATNWTIPGQTMLECLAMIETGARLEHYCKADSKVGRSGEVSRYQIKPKEWHKYSMSKWYSDPKVSTLVAAKILKHRMMLFHGKHQREPTAFEIYVLWNAPDYLIGNRKGKPISKRVAERAQRFSNLVLEK